MQLIVMEQSRSYASVAYFIQYRAVAAYLKVVQRRKASSAEGTRGGEHKRGTIPPFARGVWGPPPRKFLNFERFYVRF